MHARMHTRRAMLTHISLTEIGSNILKSEEPGDVRSDAGTLVQE